MTVLKEINLQDLETWQGATETKERIIGEGKENEFEQLIEELYPQGIDEVELNDLLWFDDESIYDYLGIDYES